MENGNQRTRHSFREITVTQAEGSWLGLKMSHFSVNLIFLFSHAVLEWKNHVKIFTFVDVLWTYLRGAGL